MDKNETTNIIGRKHIWWLASYPKSGNTWIRMFLNCYVTRFPVNLNSPFQYAAGDLGSRMYQLTCPKPLTEWEPIDTIYYRHAVLMNFINMSSTPDICLKTHHAKLDIENITLIPSYITKGAVYIVRDPRDIAVSLCEHMEHDTFEDTIAMMGDNKSIVIKNEYKALFHFLTSWSSHVDSWTLHNKDITTLTVRYEDMINRTDETFRYILNALGFDKIDEDGFQFALKQTCFANLQRVEQEKGFAEQANKNKFFKRGKVGSWTTHLPANCVQTIIDNHGETMKRHSYEF